MSAFIWTIVVMLSLDVAGLLLFMTKDEPIIRSKRGMALDIITYMALVGWGLWLLGAHQ